LQQIAAKTLKDTTGGVKTINTWQQPYFQTTAWINTAYISQTAVIGSRVFQLEKDELEKLCVLPSLTLLKNKGFL